VFDVSIYFLFTAEKFSLSSQNTTEQRRDKV